MEQYRIQERLGDALYGAVWRATDLRNPDEDVAIKQIDLGKAGKALDLFGKHLDNPLREHQTIECIRRAGGHPNVLRVHGVFVANDNMHIVMDLCDGGDLFGIVQRAPEQRLRESVSLHYFRRIVSAVLFLHEHGIAHRDLSLENVLVRQNVVKLCDFGLSVRTSTKCSDIVGKAYYMAPEVAAGRSYDPAAADLWSLGIMLFIMLTGSPMMNSTAPDDAGFQAFRMLGLHTPSWNRGVCLTKCQTRRLIC
ncbi:TPA: hypothetical protein N0F65_003285 [Lagenidium giganteum]|uniref:Protein kinase domain-containing protein n=1 Tax=Lagenidium giganteum TaxID=4803 RepID=A0AAV2YWT6_9STRA|nr:TPA: hypothetical protein N0F65_003285 [Lagenidium giganteum]